MESFDRIAYAESVLSQLVMPPEKHDAIYKNFWANYFNKQSLRLTKRGFVILSKELRLEYYTAHLKYKSKGMDQFGIMSPSGRCEDTLDGAILIVIDRIMTCPYYLYPEGKMEIFGEKERAWLAMHDDNIAPFLESWK